ncbi:MAG TPA: tyrosine-type recombinase/integrase [Sporosarcina psychrophila]|uniref:Tyrosine-type recombinase/integrase n=1 Tax=Sporosarcina psychrophila TaxID=1476 RepID=A0A921G2G1_SPOPS|nr:tyrosine-type recombinase/integrase [Sporosarcina psychrophila]
MKKRRTSSTGKGLTWSEGRELIIRIKLLEGRATRTIEGYIKLFNDFERCFGVRKHMTNVTQDDARKFIEWQLNEKTQFLKARFRKDKKIGVSVVSANSYLRNAKAAYEVLIKEGIIEENPFRNINKIKEKKKIIEILSLSELKEILNAYDKTWYVGFRDYVIVNVMLDSFGRIMEICHLKKSDIDFEKGLITFTETKNGSYRIVPVTKKVLNLIKELNKETEEFNSPYVFMSSHGTQLVPDAFRKNLRDVIAKTSIVKRVHPHIFRHTSASLFLVNGGSIRALQKILGHADISTTMIYSHMNNDALKEQHEQFSPLQQIEEHRKIKTRIAREPL